MQKINFKELEDMTIQEIKDLTEVSAKAYFIMDELKGGLKEDDRRLRNDKTD